jgi:hypothetical protein
MPIFLRRLDFQTFEIGAPSNDIANSLSGLCNTDSFAVSGQVPIR